MLRTSLGSISSNKRPHTQYSSYQRGLIHGVVAAGVTSYRIEKFYKIAQFTIKFIVSNVLIRHIDDSKPRSNRPKKLIVRDEQHILRIARREPRITYKDLIAKSEVAVSHNTIYRLLKEAGIIN